MKWPEATTKGGRPFKSTPRFFVRSRPQQIERRRSSPARSPSRTRPGRHSFVADAPPVYKDHVKRETIQRIATPTVILVGLSEEIVARCAEVLDDSGLRVLRVGHVAAASERIPVVMPQLVLVGDVRPQELELLTDRCVAVGAEVMTIAPDADPAALTTMLKTAARAALIKALGG